MASTTGSIFVALDGSEEAERALLPAGEIASALNSPLAVVMILGDAPDSPAEIERGTHLLQTYVERCLRETGYEGPWSAEIGWGPVAPALLDAASQAQLVVMATHGKGGFQSAFIGSVTDKVVRAARFPVLTVPAEDGPTLRSGPILVGLDGSEVAERALAVARLIGAALGSELVLLRAFFPPTPVGLEYVGYYPETESAMQEEAEEYLKRVADEGEKTIAVRSPATLAIKETADELGASMVALATHGKGFASRLALGSTTDRVLHMVRRPILIVPVERRD